VDETHYPTVAVPAGWVDTDPATPERIDLLNRQGRLDQGETHDADIGSIGHQGILAGCFALIGSDCWDVVGI
jgi:hypothetical protein